MPKSPEERKRELIDGLVTARRAVLEAAESIPPEQREEVFLGVWSLMDLLAHLAGWDATNLQAVQEILSGQAPGFFQYFDKDWQNYNAGLVRQYRRETFAEMRSDLEASHQQLITYLEELPPGDLLHGKVRRENGRTITIRNLLRAEARDELKHAEQVKAYSRG